MNNTTKRQIELINQRIKEINSIYHNAAAELGISDGELYVWSVLLDDEKEYSQQELCELLFLSKQTVNSIISNLIKKGFVVLEHIPGTRNRKRIHLTDEGADYGKTRIQWLFQAEDRALEQTDSKQVEICINMMESYILNLKKEILSFSK